MTITTREATIDAIRAHLAKLARQSRTPRQILPIDRTAIFVSSPAPIPASRNPASVLSH